MGNVSIASTTIAAASRGYGGGFFWLRYYVIPWAFCFVGLFFSLSDQPGETEGKGGLAFFVFGILAGLYPRLIWMAEVVCLLGLLYEIAMIAKKKRGRRGGGGVVYLAVTVRGLGREPEGEGEASM